MVVSLKTDLRFPIHGQQGHGGRIIQKISQKIVNEIFDEKTIIFTSHVDSDIQYADRVFALQGDGTLIEL